jgi:hypothetical protein
MGGGGGYRFAYPRYVGSAACVDNSLSAACLLCVPLVCCGRNFSYCFPLFCGGYLFMKERMGSHRRVVEQPEGLEAQHGGGDYSVGGDIRQAVGVE